MGGSRNKEGRRICAEVADGLGSSCGRRKRGWSGMSRARMFPWGRVRVLLRRRRVLGIAKAQATGFAFLGWGKFLVSSRCRVRAFWWWVGVLQVWLRV